MAPPGIGRRVEGVHAVAAAVDAGRITKLWVEKRRLRHDDIGSIVEAARRRGAVVEITDSVAEVARSENAQGVVADGRPVPVVSIDDLAGPGAAILVLDHFEDPHNVGAAARSARAAGMTGLVVPERRAAPLGPSAFKAASGALEHLPVCVVSSTADALSRLRDRSIWTVGLTVDAQAPLFGLQLLTEPVAVVVGSEGAGLGRLVSDRLDLAVSIPMAAGVESLNASVAAALTCFEVARVRGTRFASETSSDSL